MKNSTSPPPPYPSGPGRIFLLLSASEFCLYFSMKRDSPHTRSTADE